ncbi:Uncharacterised protein [Mycobacteroides abscessus subsp. abscessus]|nr:Uncharacterised protein [Mycobacteroides abscessus subsp. abscessus]
MIEKNYICLAEYFQSMASHQTRIPRAGSNEEHFALRFGRNLGINDGGRTNT